MSDLDDLVGPGIYPTTIRWNAELGCLNFSAYDTETGERDLKEIELGPSATFAMDLATRERGYAKIQTGFYDAILTAVGSPPPDRPDDPEYKAAVGCWMWNPSLNELRAETNGVYFRQALTNTWDRCRLAPQAAEGKQPVIRFTDRIEVHNKKYHKTFFAPKIEVVGWVERDRIPGWGSRPPTVLPPSPLSILPFTPMGSPAAEPLPAPDKPAVAARATKPERAKPGGVKRSDAVAEYLDDDLPDNLK